MDIKNMHDMLEKLVCCAKAELDKKGVEEVDTEEMGKVVDIIKDLAEAEYYRTITVAMEESDHGEDYDEDDRRGYRGQPRSKTSGRYMSRGDGRRSNRGRMGYEEVNPMYYDDEYMRDMDRYGMGRMYYSVSTGTSGGATGGAGGQNTSGSMPESSTGNSGGMRGYTEDYRGYSDGRRNHRDGTGGQMASRSENARRGYEETKLMNDNSPEGKKKAMESLENYMKELSEDMTEMVGKMDNSEKTMLKTKLTALANKIN